MREIVFRGKGIFNGEWFYGDLLKYEDELGKRLQIVTSNKGCRMHNHTVDPTTVGQFTGMLDSDGKEIYEGDIVRAIALSNDHHQRGAISDLTVKYYCGRFCFCYNGYETGVVMFPFCIDHTLEVIGNIHDNPELLREA